MAKKIRVMIIDDSMIFLEFLSRSLSLDPAIEVVGTFSDPVAAQLSISKLQPDVITTDMEMPKMRGDECIKKILPMHPGIKIIVISSLSSNVFDAMQAGATEFVGKPNFRPGYGREQFAADIKRAVRIAATAKAVTVSATQATLATMQPSKSYNMTGITPKSVIAIGASTGGTEAIVQVVQGFPQNTPGVVIVQHMPPVFTAMYADRLNRICKMEAKEAKSGDRVKQGMILVASGDQHMRLRADAQGYFVHCMPGPKVSGHCPSVDVLFESVALTAGANAVGVILTGMGADGAKQLKALHDKGAYTIGQDQASSMVYGMPKVAYDLGGVSKQLSLNAICDAVLRRFCK